MRRVVICILSMLLFAGMLLNLAGCARLDVSAEDLTEKYSRNTSSKGKITDDFTGATIGFSFDLFRQTAGAYGRSNKLISPVSVEMNLAILLNGAEGETKTQLENVLGIDRNSLNKGLYAFGKSFSNNVSSGNSLWIRDSENFSVKKNFLQNVVNWFDAEVYRASFDDSTVNDMNKWVRFKTDDMIDEIQDEPLDPDTMMVLLNSLYFESEWKVKYKDKDINPGLFYNYDGTQSNVKYMTSKETKCLYGDGLVGFAKPYKNGKYSFVGLIPNDHNEDIIAYLPELTGEKWLSLWNNPRNKEVEVKIPEFTFEGENYLNEALKKMGITDLFDVDYADLSGISDNGLFVSEISQNTFISVNREGTKAAAVTKTKIQEGGIPDMISLSRPFIYMIVDNETGIPLFIGLTVKL